jgi:ABC-type antimicrobial peptide transport system permease subunit
VSGVTYALAGIALGTASSLAIWQTLSSRIPALQGITPTLLGILGLAVVVIATLATLIPAWRATRIDPVLTLRAE